MPWVPTLSPATGKPVPAHYIHTTAGQFVDTAGRTVIFRGVNLSGSSKAPVGQQSHVLEGFWEKAEAGGESFVNQPLNLDDGTAEVHLARLRGWGFNVLRFPVTWEALEHAGPRKYDYEFMDYVVRVLRKCKEFGFKVFMDPHQDVWSRFTGGSGAPLWTVYACGLDPKNLTKTLAHVLHCESEDPEQYPSMIWSTNYGRLASQTLFTMFFAGREFTPKCIIDDVNIQDWLQDHFISAFGALADRIRDTAADLYDECIIGWDSMNEPSEGLIGYPDLTKSSTKQTAQLKKGPFATPAQGFRLGMGTAQTLENWEFGGFGPSQKGTVTVDPQGVRAWLDPVTEPGCVDERWGWKRDPGWTLGICVWALHGVWDIATGEVLQPQYFHPNDAEPAFTTEYFRPHWQKWAARIRSAHPEAIHFLQPPVFVPPPPLDEADVRGRLAYSTHYYDGLTLVSRHWSWFNADAVGIMRGKYGAPWQAAKLGESAIRRSLQEQLAILKNDAPSILGDYPTLIGEIGVPFDMDDRWSYGYTDGGRGLGNYKNQQKALDASLNGCDGPNALNYTMWTYCPDGSHKWGDGWNLEDLSIWSADDLRNARSRPPKYATARSSSTLIADATTRTPLLDCVQDMDASGEVLSPFKSMSTTTSKITSVAHWDSTWDFLNDGARAVGALVRPFPRATVGTPVRWDFDIAKAFYSFVVRVSADDVSPASTVNPDESRLPTEIFIPLVHYAAPEALLWPSVGDSPETSTLDVWSTKSKRSAGDMSMQSLGYADSPRDSPTPGSGEMQLALDIKVSDGHWEVLHESQTLRWWYRVPARGEPDVEYRIDVKRAGGPIRTHANGRPVLSGEELQEEEWSVGQLCNDLKNWCFST